eukprot:gb/GECG01009544.1/.p1 GENE.gb/GECG01009544.1/~~gb/GECG01009544.1/.p1  ORF type:complete len:945 (+),score=130.26 gb/GECG01009544.1/:1-2835(+)
MSMFRGLTNFIAEIRKCKNREEEQMRVEKELANIRKHFTATRISDYDRKKYTWKLVYIHMLGYEVDFGTTEMISLLGGSKFSEKVAGYLAVQVLLHQNDEQIHSVIAAIKADLRSNVDSVQGVALSSIGNIGGKTMAQTLAPEVLDLALSKANFPAVRRKAILCLLRMYRVDHTVVPVESYAEKFIELLKDRDMTVRHAALALILGTAKKNEKYFENVVPVCVNHLRSLCHKQVPETYMYHHTPAPWYQIKLLQILQFFQVPDDPTTKDQLEECLQLIMTNTKVTRSVNRNNAEHSVLFEAVDLIIHYGEDGDKDLRERAVDHLSRFVHIREPNIRYLGLDGMARLVKLEGPTEGLKKHQEAIFVSLKDPDISIRKRSLDLLFLMCDKTSSSSIVKELLSYLVTAEYDIKEEMVLKLAILAERFAPDLRWYVDTMLQLIATAGDFAAEEIWHRIVQIVVNNKNLQRYAAWKLYQSLELPTAHEMAVKVGAYILGEYGFYLTSECQAQAPDGGADTTIGTVSVGQQFDMLHQHFERVSNATKCIMLNSYAKMQNMFPDELRSKTVPVFNAYSKVIDTELQQRAIEYLNLPKISQDTVAHVLAMMPEYPESELTSLDRKLKSGTAGDDEEEEEEEDEEEDDESSHRGRGKSQVEENNDEELIPDLVGGSEQSTNAYRPAQSSGPSEENLPTKASNKIGVEDSGNARKKWLMDLMVKPGGVLYQDSYVQMGVKMQFDGYQGQIKLFIGNRTGSPFNMLKIRVPEHEGLKATVGETPKVVGANKQVQIPITVDCFKPFSKPAPLQVSFLSFPENGHAYSLHLPAFVTHFMEPASLPPQKFDQIWGTLSENPKQQSTSFSAPPSTDMEKLKWLTGALGFGTIRESGSLQCAGTFRTSTKNNSGQLISIGCLMELSLGPGGDVRVDVRTKHQLVTQALVKALNNCPVVLQ